MPAISINMKHGINYIIATIIVISFGLSYIAVPLYQLFCQKTGYGGTIKLNGPVLDNFLDDKITVYFEAQIDPALEIKFYPQIPLIDTNIGQTTLVFYLIENLTGEEIRGISTFNITPNQVGEYFHKIQCFCFEEQRIGPYEQIELPILFYVDPIIKSDVSTLHMNQCTLSYTMYKSKG